MSGTSFIKSLLFQNKNGIIKFIAYEHLKFWIFTFHVNDDLYRYINTLVILSLNSDSVKLKLVSLTDIKYLRVKSSGIFKHLAPYYKWHGQGAVMIKER
ncbi:hypothetical protein BKP35_01360 [Anaerobacillus arseniciselenatis]|uniref:Uncharacterized protein n=1 Tax=Anaerobacillus arseniciselenatis TaxID=85682 RepID=A0A1S2LT33_9BACI|nr:hypothetical protein BKP35_01360 [Anaerobacillus arseniciselenatis]